MKTESVGEIVVNNKSKIVEGDFNGWAIQNGHIERNETSEEKTPGKHNLSKYIYY